MSCAGDPATLWCFAHGDLFPDLLGSAEGDPLLAADQPHPFREGGLFGPWPRCWPRLLLGWYRYALPPP